MVSVCNASKDQPTNWQICCLDWDHKITRSDFPLCKYMKSPADSKQQKVGCNSSVKPLQKMMTYAHVSMLCKLCGQARSKKCHWKYSFTGIALKRSP